MIKLKKYEFSSCNNSFGSKKKIKIKFISNDIEAIVYIILFSKKLKRKNMELKDVFESIKLTFLNLAECRPYKVFKEKYFEIFEKEFDELLSPFTKDMYFYYRISNNDYIFTSDCTFFNQEKDDYCLKQVINTDECTLYIVLAKKE